MIAIQSNNLTKIYKLYEKPIDRLKESLNPFKKKYYKEFYALKNVTFDVKKGETVGIIGKNGAGKSTLLKIITGVLTPTSGCVNVNGKIASLLELGAGFNPEMTGLENVYLQGTIMGFTKEEIDKKIDEILSFADIGEFIYQPVKMYSSGMFARLAFATAINVEPEILIVDEALSVGDVRFQNKCFRKMNELKERGLTILFVSHDTGAINNFCNRVIWLDKGEIKMIGEPKDIIKHYIAFMSYGLELKKTNSENDVKDNKTNKEKKQLFQDKIKWVNVTDKFSSFGDGRAVIKKIAFYDESYNDLALIINPERKKVIISLIFDLFDDIESFIAGVIIKNSNNIEITGLNNLMLNKNISLKKNNKIKVDFEFNLPKLANGKYTLTVSVAEGTKDNHIQMHFIYDVYEFEVMNINKELDYNWIFLPEESNLRIENE